jgi:hypothetical protein
MVQNIPPLGWLPHYVQSIERAVGSSIRHEVKPTVNPLQFTIKLFFSGAISGKAIMLIWNLFQVWANTNDAIPQGKLEKDQRTLLLSVVVKRRLGPPKDTNPLDTEKP